MAEKARITLDEIDLIEVTSSPSVTPGILASIGSVAIMIDGSALYLKNAASNTSWSLLSPGALSAGFTWGASGPQNAGSYLLNDGVPSNKAGRIISLNSGSLVSVSVTSFNNDSFSIKIQKRSGNVFVDLVTVTISNSRTFSSLISPVALSVGDELACLISSGICSNPIVSVQVKGST